MYSVLIRMNAQGVSKESDARFHPRFHQWYLRRRFHVSLQVHVLFLSFYLLFSPALPPQPYDFNKTTLYS